MLAHPTHERLIALGLAGMARAFEEQRASPDLAALSFEERVGIMADREAADRDTRRTATRLKFAALRQNACVEDIDLRTPRGLDRALLARLVAGDWIDRHDNLAIIGATGVGKSWIACALGHKACRDGRSGRHARLLKSLARIDLLILDDWGLQILTQAQRIDLLEILEDRNGRGSTLITSQVPIDQWCDVIGDPTLADAILDRVVHNAHRLNLTGDSLRKTNARRTLDAAPNP
jgi:DNA replication protein DnaC